MKTFIVWYLICVASIMGLFIVESFVEGMPETSKFRQWWRRNLIDNAPSDIDFQTIYIR